MSIYFETPHLDALQREINSLKESRKLLEEIWEWYGPYDPRFRDKNQQMPENLHIALQEHFRFDDSE